jgi:hypothetical protein
MLACAKFATVAAAEPEPLEVEHHALPEPAE